MKKELPFILVLLVLLVLYLLLGDASKPVDWSENYSMKKKEPYGTYIVTKALPFLFPEGDIHFSTRSVNHTLQREWEMREGYLFVNRTFDVNEEELDLLLSYVEAGNILFVSATLFPDQLLASFHLSTTVDWGNFSHTLKYRKEKTYHYSGFCQVFEPGENFAGEILGLQDEDEVNFVRVPYGEGEVYLHCYPEGFSNKGLLDTLTGDYYAAVLSHLPPDIDIIWDEYQKSGRGYYADEDSPMRVILGIPALRLGYYLVLLGALLFLIFRSKREQRIIPVVLPPENQTLEFVATVSSLYYKQRDHTSIALKRIDGFLKEVRYHYKLRTDLLDEHFAVLLSERSGVAQAEVEQLVELILMLKEQEAISESRLKELNRCVEQVVFQPDNKHKKV